MSGPIAPAIDPLATTAFGLAMAVGGAIAGSLLMRRALRCEPVPTVPAPQLDPALAADLDNAARTWASDTGRGQQHADILSDYLRVAADQHQRRADDRWGVMS